MLSTKPNPTKQPKNPKHINPRQLANLTSKLQFQHNNLKSNTNNKQQTNLKPQPGNTNQNQILTHSKQQKRHYTNPQQN